jgi:hypothetical protein
MLEELVQSEFVGVDYHDGEWEGEGRMNIIMM